MSDADLQIIELTEKQAELADWLMGLPWIDHWDDPERDGPEGVCEYEKKYDQPKLKGRRMAVPPTEEFADHIEEELDKYQQMALDAAEVDTIQAMNGLKRTCRNLMEKLREVSNQ